MAMTMRTGGLFAAGLLVGVALGGWAVIHAHDKAVWQDNGPGTHAATMGNAPASAATGTSQTPVAAPAQAAPAAAPVVASAVAAKSCDTTAIVPRGREDGQESLQSAPSTATASEVSALLLTGKEAAASGRMRDAEIVFLNACRDAQVVQGKDAALTLADAMYQLGRHYATVAQSGSASRTELLSRSQRLYQAALQTYQARYGDKGEKTRFAQQGLATVQRLAGGAPLPAAPAVAQAPAPALAPAAKPPVKAELAAKPPAPPRVAAVKPAKTEEPRTPTTAAEPRAPKPPVAAVEARLVPKPPKAPKPQEKPRVEKPAHEEPSATTAAVVEPPKSAPRTEAPRGRREPVHPAVEADTATIATPQPSASPPQVSVVRPRPAPVRVAPPEAESRPIAPMREAPVREAPRRAARPADDSGDETSAPIGTAEGSAGTP
jgi:hypothetical protein